MRSDPYRERARALAVEAGLDPDAKIDRPGQRPMPLWCTFRDAARKGDENYRLGALPIATYTELQKQYLDTIDALLSTQADALEARQQLELLTGIILGDAPVPPLRPADTAIKRARK